MAIYHTIISDIKKQIQAGDLKKGDKLPSIRQLSQYYHCSKDTVQKALLELSYQNDIYAIPKSGYYVLENKAEHIEPVIVSISDYNNIAYDDFLLCMNESLVGRELYLFNQYDHPEGLLELRQSLKNYLANTGVYTNIPNIIVTSGTQQALYILSQMTFPNYKKTILLEQPTYHRMNTLVKSQGLAYQTIDRGFEGLDFGELENLFKERDIKFFYTISRYSNPLGLSYHLKEQKMLLDLAEKYDVYIIEDDYMGDFTKGKEAPLHYYDTHERIIYLKSFSTTLFSALRLGMIVLPNKLKSEFLAYKKLLDYDTNLIIQKAMSLYLDNGMFDKNLRYLKKVFQKNQAIYQDVIDAIPSTIPYQLTPKQVILQLPKNSLIQRRFYLKSIPSPSESYINSGEVTYIKLDIDEQLPKHLNQLLDNRANKKSD
ncbi:PLP-dependent aminotransferase family protein [Streptococcus saliviloxodontae]|uniref:DNA-binding transcriptional MocR family regulator n=1 Tax=Streptococcus saliviloxodontae TaxID=1349416 RepID=A0ABS2PNI5_9STRE|nr:PLP-dependent aminotransferase family protein [Streptococcus saliviloxodontae]MBM7636914.1 DNA-binding transcriptional MocR family regulator [Streptococcus saliviloxodontae]